MVKIHNPKKPSKKSGYELAPGCDTKVKGLLISNQNDFPVYIDKFMGKKPKKKKLKK